MKFEVTLERDGDSEMFEDLARYLKFHPNLLRFLFNPAGFTFLIGWFLFLGMLIGWIGIWFLDPLAAAKIGATLAAEIFPGKEFAVPVGINLGLPPAIVFGAVFVQDLITTMWVYPLFYLFRRRHLGRQNFAGFFFAKMERNAKKHEQFIRRYGAWGVFLFMLVPFAVNGPLIGAIIGKLAGIRTRYILPAVVGATALTTGYWTLLWAFAQDHVQAFVDEYGGGWVVLTMVTVLVLYILKTLVEFRRDLKHFREIQRRRMTLLRQGGHEQTMVLGESVEPESDGPPPGRSHLED